jgi:hypothetical protein
MSVDDELIRHFVPDRMRRRLKLAIAVKVPGARHIAQLGISSTQRVARRMAFRQRRSLLQMDTWRPAEIQEFRNISRISRCL